MGQLFRRLAKPPTVEAVAQGKRLSFEEVRFISRQWRSLFNLCISFEWGDFTRPLFVHRLYMAPVMYAYLKLVMFGVLKLSIGVIVGKTMEAGRAFETSRPTM